MPLDTLLRDIRVGLRVLIKEKGFCSLAVVVLALGIAGVTTMFSVVNGVMLRGFSFPNGDRLTSLNFVDPSERRRSSASTARSRRWTSRSCCRSRSRSTRWPPT